MMNISLFIVLPLPSSPSLATLMLFLTSYTAGCLQNRLVLNSFKDPTCLACHRIPLDDFDCLAESFLSFIFLSTVVDLGVILDSTLAFSAHIVNLTC